ncbi:G patch domain-containing protein 1 homolog [Condylostylus longicornis]|uniref:G patch domain-containing protein 1 homolog n=1 Tax=Condylostylus longicornis TaxID=2530218 RepID=UPI00244DEE61|nr:G patch domain-containing protein 1 homolog [Condylostylus longicornis]
MKIKKKQKARSILGLSHRMDETEVFCRFGTPLEPLEENEVPSKKPILVEDQIVTDENGRRRFHGAFTGGFSAGFWNTVGSLEGWTPKEFKSSRDEKTNFPTQKPSDFMDDEDFSEFGIAPQRIQTTEEFSDSNRNNNKKRKIVETCGGPIPGVPVLQQLIEPCRDNIALRILKKMGWKEGQGIGPRQTLKEKKYAKQRFEEQSSQKKYGCDMGPIGKTALPDSEESDLSDMEGVTFAPDDYEPFIYTPKDNVFGLGYTGLSRDPVLKQNFNLFEPLEVLDNEKKLSIRGKGFGVGALEEEDEDIYHHDDMSNYDFSLENQTNKSNRPVKTDLQDLHVIEGFCSAKECNSKPRVFDIIIPKNFTPRNWLQRKSRFEPLDEERAALLKKQQDVKNRGLGRHDVTLDERRAILEDTKIEQKSVECREIKEKEDLGNKRKLNYLEKINEKYKVENKKDEILDMLASKSCNFVKSEVINEDGTISHNGSNTYSETVQKEIEVIQNGASKITKKLDSTTSNIFKPFLADLAKQERYENFLNKTFKSDEEIISYLGSIQPPTMSEWDRQMEKKEFEQAKRIYKPLKGIMSDRFVSESSENAEKASKIIDPDRRGKTVRTKSTWHPISLICKRFNIAEPFVNLIKEENAVKKPKLSIFDYLEDSVNKKDSFVTPTIIPKAEEFVKVNLGQRDSPKRLSAKDMFSKEIGIGKDSSLEIIIPIEVESNTKERVSSEDSISIDVGSNTAEKEKEIVSNDNRNIATRIAKKENSKTEPKNELEKEIEELKDKPLSEKKSVYKKIFEDFSDNEEHDLNSKSIDNTERATHNTEKDEENLKFPANFVKTAAEINILRNNSPPRGIFAAFFRDPSKTDINHRHENVGEKVKTGLPFDTNEKHVERNNESILMERDDKDSSIIYGPKVNTSTSELNQSISNKPKFSVHDLKPTVDDKLLKLMEKHKKKSKIVEEWVELTHENIKQKKNSKKDKKRKKKKDRSKHRCRSGSSSESSSASSDSSHRVKKKSKKSKKSKKHKK